MPKNKTGGSKHKKSKKVIENKSLRLKQTNELYGKVTQVLGNCRFKVLCEDGLERIGILRGKYRKRKYINLDNIVLLEIWEFQNDKISIIETYYDDQVKNLKKLDELPSLLLNENTTDNDYCSFTFDNDIDEEIETEEKINSTSEEDEIDLEDI